METVAVQKNHKLILNNRKAGLVTGVLDVLSFNLNEILLETEQGMLMVRGTDLHVNRVNLEKGEIDLSGNIDSISIRISIRQQSRQEVFLKSYSGDLPENRDVMRNKENKVKCKMGIGKELFIFLWRSWPEQSYVLHTVVSAACGKWYIMLIGLLNWRI